MYTPFEMDTMLNSMKILVDTREQPNRKFKQRVSDFGHEWRRQKLDFGDYSAEYENLDGEAISLADKVAIERKMDLNELALCFGKERKRFEREFVRAKQSNAKIYLLVEEDDWSSAYSGEYGRNPKFRSLLRPGSLTASMHAFQARYRMNIQFCDSSLTGLLIADILKYELREILENESSS